MADGGWRMTDDQRADGYPHVAEFKHHAAHIADD